VLSFDDFRALLVSGRILLHIGRYSAGRVLVRRIESAGRPLPLAVALRALCHGPIYLEDGSGRRRRLTLARLAAWTLQMATEPFRVGTVLAQVGRDLDRLDAARPRGPLRLAPDAPPLYLRSDLSFGVRAGGSVGHIAGVLNELANLTGRPIFLTTDEVPTLRPDVEVHYVDPSEAFWNFSELPSFLLNEAFQEKSARVIAGRRISFVYQRHSLNNYAGVLIARTHGVPFVLEFNGSEIWMSRHWGRPLKHEALSARIEQLNVASADLVIVVSRAIRDELIARGVESTRILVNFNGVDAACYRPEVDGGQIRRQHGGEGRTVIGFIGTFGPWHGAQVLARAFVRLLQRQPALRPLVRLLMIGDGVGLPEVRRIVREGGVGDAVAFTGLVPQEDGPRHLAACDILVSPHVPNPDGSPFFGSPTKLFEYMAMGKGIVASDLEQIGEVLQHGRDAWLVPPGDIDCLADALARLVAEPALRARLGAAARKTVLERYTWGQHTRRTVDTLRSMFPASRVDQPAVGA
jgi:glycosyltransferase involved in cell wall biosynthesis